MIRILNNTKEDLIALEAEGKIVKEDYENFLPLLDEMVKKHEKIKAYIEVKELDGVTLPALWEEIKGDVKYFDNFNRVAVVGEAKWKETATKAANILPHVEAKYFDISEKQKAKEWIEEDKN